MTYDENGDCSRAKIVKSLIVSQKTAAELVWSNGNPLTRSTVEAGIGILVDANVETFRLKKNQKSKYIKMMSSRVMNLNRALERKFE